MLKLDIGFNVDTSSMRRALNELSTQLRTISSASFTDQSSNGIVRNIDAAKESAKQLSAYINTAINQDTGRLNFNKLNQSLKENGQSLTTLARNLRSLGTEGNNAFNNLTKSVLNAEMPLRKTSNLVNSLAVSLKNTIKWQFSSSVLMGFTGAIRDAFSYAKNLNESLTNIRIVTGQSAEQMARFAEQANKAAKSLGTTTTAYTDAALIYYQQGLGDAEVLERATVTTKMATVTGESAQDVSSYMTAIWNNFDDGSKSLEYYADVITALGAATASSSEEIAGGLEKFAAIGQTVGLSYEYATAALATVVSTTRQSEDVVGTSFKTIFARLQGLQQGEEQEDGVTLNKYSAALQKVGINIIDVNGELKAMDDILDELGNKWKTLEQAEKVALAQTVGGVRQYTQLISLMENWDTFKENVDIASGSSGALEQQSEIYRESWQAASNEVQAALEGLWQSLLNDKGFIDFLHNVEKLISLFDRLIEGMGGFKGLLTTLGTTALYVFEKQIAQGINNIAYNLTPYEKKIEDFEKVKQQLIRENLNGEQDITHIAQTKFYQNQVEIAKQSQHFNEWQAEYARISLRLQEESIQHIEENQRAIENSASEWGGTRNLILEQALLNNVPTDIITEEMIKIDNTIDQVITATDAASKLLSHSTFGDIETSNFTEYSARLQDILRQYQLLDKNGNIVQARATQMFGPEVTSNLIEYWNAFKNGNMTTKEASEGLARIANEMLQISTDSVAGEDAIARLRASLQTLGFTSNDVESIIQDVKRAMDEGGNAAKVLKERLNELGSNPAANLSQTTTSAKVLTTSLRGLTSALGVVNGLAGVFNSLMDDTKTTGEKASAAISGIASTGMQAVFAFTSLQKAFQDIKAGSSLSWLAKFGPQIAIIIAGLYALITAINLIQKKMKEDSAEEKVKRLSEETEKLTAKYKELKNSLDSLASVKDTLNDLTEGSLEWKQAIIDINQQVLSLLKLYPQLAQYITTDPKTGMMSISQEGMDAILEEQKKITQSSQIASLHSMAYAELSKDSNPTVVDLAFYKNGMNQASHNGSNIESVHGNTAGSTILNSPDFIDAGDAVQLYKDALAAGAIIADENGALKFNWDLLSDNKTFQKIKNDQSIETYDELNNLRDAFDSFIPTLTKWNGEIEQSVSNFQALNKNTALSWMDANNTVVPDELRGVYAEALAIEEAKVTNVDKNRGSGDWKAAYAEYTGMDETRVQQLLDSQELTEEMLKSYVIGYERYLEANKIVSERYDKVLELFKQDPDLINAENQESIVKIILGGGDRSTWDSFTPDQASKLATWLSSADGLDDLLVEYGLTTQDLIDTLGSPEYEKASEQNRREKYEATARMQAKEYDMDDAAYASYQNYLIKQIPELQTLMEEYDPVVNEITKKYLQWDKNAKAVNETLDDTKDALSNTKDIVKYNQAITKVANSLGDLFGFDIASSFLDKKMLKRIKTAFSKNDAKEIKKIFEEAVAFDLKLMVPESEQEAAIEKVQTVFSTINSEIKDKKIKIGDLIDFDKSGIDDALWDVADQVGITADKASDEFEKRFGIRLKYQEYPIVDGTVSIGNESGTVAEMVDKFAGSFEAKGVFKVPVGFQYTGHPGGGGGGGGAKPSGGSKKKDKKKKSDEIEQFHKEKRELERLSKELDEIDRKKNRAFGKGKLKLYDEEIEKLKELRDAQKDLVEKQRTDLEKKKTGLEKYGVQIDPVTGEILNYEEVYEKQISKFNKKRTEKAEKEYEEFKKKMEEYEKALDELKQNEDEYEKYLEQIHDEGLEAVKYKVEYQVELNDSDMQFLDYFLDKLSDNIFDLVDKIDLIEGKMLESLDNYSIYLEGIADIFRNLNELRGTEHSPFADLTEEDIGRLLSGDYTTEDLEKWGLLDGTDLTEEDMLTLNQYKDSLLQLAKDLADYQADVYNTIVEAADAVNEEYDKQIGKLEHLFNLWDHFKNIVELTGKASGITDRMMLEMNRQAVDAKIGQVFTKSENLKTLQSQLDDIEKDLIRDEKTGEIIGSKTLASTGSSLEDLKRNYEDLQAKVREAKEELLSSWQDALTEANNYFQASVELVIKGFEEAMSGTFGSLERLQDAYGKQKELNDFYLDDYKQIYELTKLTRDITKSIDETDNIASKNKLKEIQQEINDLQEAGVELTQYDLDQLRAKYELRLAEIALEDAQNAKNQVRMTRDSEGNWSYTYTADQDSIDKAQQNYEDKLYAMQNLTSNYIETMQEQIMNLNSQMAQELAGVDKSLFATEEEYLAELNRIREYYAEKSNKLMDQINKALGDNRELYENDWKAYSEATGYKISANEDYIDSWNETQYALLSGYDTIEDYQRAFTTLLGSVDDENSLIGQMVSAYREWHSIVKEIEDSTGMGLDELLAQVGQITSETEKVKQETVELSKEIGEAWKNILADIQEFSNTLAKTIEDAVNGIESQVENLIKLIKSLYQQEVPGPTQLPGPNNASQYDTGGYTGSWGKNGKLAVLHEKELILNAEDTRNMLKVVGMTRDIAKQIELNAIAAGSGLSNFAPGSVGQFQQVEQNIVINADFPNASNREEIAAAFDNLLNRASQYANRKI